MCCSVTKELLSELFHRMCSVSYERSQWDEITGSRAAIFARRFVFWRQHVLQSPKRFPDAMEKPLESRCVNFAWTSCCWTWHYVYQPFWTQGTQCQEHSAHRLPGRFVKPQFNQLFQIKSIYFSFVRRSLWQQVCFGRLADDNELCSSSTNIRKSYQLHPVAPKRSKCD